MWYSWGKSLKICTNSCVLVQFWCKIISRYLPILMSLLIVPLLTLFLTSVYCWSESWEALDLHQTLQNDPYPKFGPCEPHYELDRLMRGSCHTSIHKIACQSDWHFFSTFSTNNNGPYNFYPLLNPWMNNYPQGDPPIHKQSKLL